MWSGALYTVQCLLMLLSSCLYWHSAICILCASGCGDLDALLKKNSIAENLQGSLIPLIRTEQTTAREGFLRNRVSWWIWGARKASSQATPWENPSKGPCKPQKPLDFPCSSCLNLSHNHSSVNSLSRLTANNQIVKLIYAITLEMVVTKKNAGLEP